MIQVILVDKYIDQQQKDSSDLYVTAIESAVACSPVNQCAIIYSLLTQLRANRASVAAKSVVQTRK
jgi:hypothetical protein